MQVKLREIASVIRSKNAGPYELTFDVLLKDADTFEMVRKSNVINKQMIASLYRIPESQVLGIVYFPNACAVKATIVRPIPSGAWGERDVYGAQQHGPLLDYAFELEAAGEGEGS
ncbi:MAG: DUF4387 domain-containing protein [Saccharofermentanales bacterium]